MVFRVHAKHIRMRKNHSQHSGPKLEAINYHVTSHCHHQNIRMSNENCTADELLSNVLELIANKQPAVAVTLYGKLLATDPDHFMRLANDEQGFGGKSGICIAAALAAAAFEVTPTNPHSAALLGALLLKMKQHADARMFLDKAVALGSNDPDAFFNLGLTHIALKSFDQAIEAFETAGVLNPSNAAYFNNLAIAQKRLVCLIRPSAIWKSQLGSPLATPMPI